MSNVKPPVQATMIALGVMWVFAVIIAYYVVHKPFTPENALAIASILGDVLVAAILVALGAGIGRRVTSWLHFDSPLESLVMQAGLGLGLVSLFVLGLGVLGFVQPAVFWLLAIAALFLLRHDLLVTLRELGNLGLKAETREEKILACFVAISLIVAFLFALMPPTAWDAQTYHLPQAKLALAQGRITSPPDVVYYSFPSLGEMLFVAAMALKGDVAAQLVHLTFFVLLLGAVLSLARRFFSLHAGWLACALLAAVPSLLAVSTWAYVDVILAFYTFAALSAIISASESNDSRWLLLAGVFSGLAMGVKYTAVIVPVALLVLTFSSRSLRRPSALLGFLVPAALAAAPWYLRNLAFKGNPFYPFLFGGEYWDSFRTEWFSRFGTGLLSSPLQIVTAPWDLTVFGQEGVLGYEASIGPLLLGLLPLLILTWQLAKDARASSILKVLLVFAGILYLFWLGGIAQSKLLIQTRLLFPAFPALAVAAAVGIDRLGMLDLPQFSFQRFARLVILLGLGLTGFSYVIGFAGSGNLNYLVGAETRNAYLARALGPYGDTIRFVNTSLPANSKVLFLWEPRSYYAKRTTQPDAILDQFAHLRWKFKSAENIAQALGEAGYSHILINRGGLQDLLQTGYDPISVQEVKILEELLSKYTRQVYGNVALEISAQGNRSDAGKDSYEVYQLLGAGLR